MDSLTHSEGETASPRKVDQLLAHYAQSHQNPRNETIHFFAIPLIMLSLVGLLYAAHPWIAYAFIAASMVYYARLSIVFLVTMAALSVVALVLVRTMGSAVLPFSIAQFIGHRIEGKKPSFFEDLQYLWVGPLFVLSRLFSRLGVRW